MDLWPGFLALGQTAGGGGDQGGGRDFLFETYLKNTVLPLENSKPNSREYYLLFTI